MSIKRLRWGLIGYGSSISKMRLKHVAHIGQTKGMDLVAICDTNPEQLKLAREEQGGNIRLFSSHRELTESGCCDGATIAIPNNVHASVGFDLLRS